MPELTAGRGGTAAGRSVGDVAADGGVSVVGLWSDGRYLDDPPRDVVVAPGDVLLLVGREAAIRSLEVGSHRPESDRPTALIAGRGLVGAHAQRVLADADVSVRTVDESDRAGVDVVGDATDAETLRRAGLDEADAVIAALPDDDATVLTTLSAVDGEREPTVIARLDDDGNEPNLRRAGADYVLSVTTLGGRVLVSDALDDPTIGADRQLRTAWLDGDRFAGMSVGETPVSGSTCSLVGVERDGTFVTDPDPSSVVRAGDRLVVVGPDDEVGAVR